MDELREEYQTTNSRVVGIACDVSKSADVRALADLAHREFGSVDIWVRTLVAYVCRYGQTAKVYCSARDS